MVEDATRVDEALKAFRSALTEISGLEDVSVEKSADQGPAATISLTFRGYSPSLHGTWIRAVEPIQDEEGEGIATFVTRFTSVIERQRRRAADAKALGHGKPLPKNAIGHLQIDTAVPPLALENGTDLVGMVVNLIGTLHRHDRLHKGGGMMSRAGMAIGEIPRGDEVWRYVAPTTRIHVGDHKKAASLHGHQLRVAGATMPDTILNAMVGRTVGDLVRLHPAIDGRIVRSARNEGSRSSACIALGIDQHLDRLAI